MSTRMTAGQRIASLPTGVFITLEKVKPMGSLQARKQTTNAVAFYWRYSIGAKSERVSIGIYDSSAPPKSLEPTAKGYSIAAAVRAAERLSTEHHNNRAEGGRPALEAAKQAAKRFQDEEKTRAAQYTLKALLDDYCDHLKSLGRDSHRNARSIFKLHIVEPWPDVAAMPAKDVPAETFADMMRRAIEAGKGRTANKLRSFARAAYQTAKDAKSKPSIPARFKAYGVVMNPIADTAPDETANKPAKHPLSLKELRMYWKAIQVLPGIQGAVLRLHLLTGAQRIEQLVRLRTVDVGADSIVIHDGKGRPGHPARPHAVPLTKAAAKALKECNPQGDYALSTDEGKTHLAGTTLSGWAARAVGDKLPGFQTKRLRSGVETLLASAGVSQEVRGRLQSHGVAGVQTRHYDGHDYMAEKRYALGTLQRLLEAKAATP